MMIGFSIVIGSILIYIGICFVRNAIYAVEKQLYGLRTDLAKELFDLRREIKRICG